MFVNLRGRDSNPYVAHPQGSISFDGSHESDTEGYLTDSSYVDQERRTVENIEVIEGSGESQPHRLQQLRADSGYRSMETAPPSLYTSQQSFGDYVRQMQPLDLSTSRSYSSSELESGKLGDIIEGAIHQNESIPYGDKQILQSEQTASTNIDEIYGWERPQAMTHRSASKKRREFGVGRHPITQCFMSSEYGTAGDKWKLPIKSKVREEFQEGVHEQEIQKYPRLDPTTLSSVYPRKDFCVDRRTDQLFQHFTNSNTNHGDRIKTVHRPQFHTVTDQSKTQSDMRSTLTNINYKFNAGDASIHNAPIINIDDNVDHGVGDDGKDDNVVLWMFVLVAQDFYLYILIIWFL
ncbi:hypothetical protein C0J52_19203 [Blattella germanica]|nr:hypothetical protein C0J52_19203 [Blattella germanica]